MSNWRRLPTRAARAAGERTFVRAAASSIARGRPSSRRQISVTASAFSGVRTKSGRTALARSTNRAPTSLARIASGVGVGPSGQSDGISRGGIGNSNSPLRWSGARLVTRAFRPGQAEIRRAISPAAASTCSKLSSTRMMRRSRIVRTSRSCGRSPAISRDPIALTMLERTRSASVTASRGTKATSP